MNGLSPVQEYRLLDVLYGHLEMTDRVRHQLLRLRHEQIEQQAGALQSSLALVLLFGGSAIPALWKLLPEELAWKPWCIWIVFAVAAIEVFNLVWKLYGNWREEQALTGKLRKEPDRPLEQDPRFILTQIASWGTRLSLAGDVLRSDTVDETTRAKFAAADGYCEERVRDELDRATKLHEDGELTHEEHDRVREWGRIALQQRSRQKDNSGE